MLSWTISVTFATFEYQHIHDNYQMLWAISDVRQCFKRCRRENTTPGLKKMQAGSVIAHQHIKTVEQITGFKIHGVPTMIRAALCTAILIRKSMMLRKWLLCAIVFTFSSPSLSHASVLDSACMFLSFLFHSHQKPPFPLNGPLALLWVSVKSLPTLLILPFHSYVLRATK